MYKDSKASEWIGTRGEGFYKIDQVKNGEFEFKRILPYNTGTYSINIHCFSEMDDNHLWVGTGGDGLWKYNKENNSIKRYFTAKDGTGLSHPYVFALLQDSSQYLWIGTPSGGLNLFDPKTESFQYFQNDPKNEFSLNNNIVLSLHQDRQKGLWIGTNDGLSKLIHPLNPQIFDDLKMASATGNNSLFKNFGMAEGFPNTVIYGMLEDESRNLWITTNRGLVVFNMDQEKVVKTFDVSDGLQSNEFNQNAYFKNKNKQFCIGGVNGFNVFDPDSVKNNSFIPPVVLTGISIFNEALEISKKNSVDGFVLDEAIHSIDEIDLLWKHNVISFEFAALSFISPEKNQFRYMLEGFDKGWINAVTRHSATYTHLDPGKYVFRVQASNNSGIWNEAGSDLDINISAPPWLSWYAYLVYFILFISAIYGYLRYRINKATQEIKIRTEIEAAREQEREEFRKQSAADFHDEVGNKITKISLFTELARSEVKSKPHLEGYLDKIQLNISELSSGMRDFLWVMDPKHDSLFETLSRLKDFGDSILTETGVRFTIHGMNAGLHSIQLSMNTRRELLQIFKEAMNNCAKYADAGEVNLITTVNDNSIGISLRDNGKGFEYTNEIINNKYGLKIMHERAKKMGAELHIKSEKYKGTTISLKCNMPHLGNSN
ncbi:MAG: hypothetical protein K9H16_07010, partial [Bacteroidales bacterium]|nr:hypothetical protein [Bacteroidales bacterium]